MSVSRIRWVGLVGLLLGSLLLAANACASNGDPRALRDELVASSPSGLRQVAEMWDRETLLTTYGADEDMSEALRRSSPPGFGRAESKSGSDPDRIVAFKSADGKCILQWGTYITHSGMQDPASKFTYQLSSRCGERVL